MKKLVNDDGTYNVYNRSADEWLIANKEWLDSISMTGITELEIFYEHTKNELKVIYENGNELWYEDINGTWGNPHIYN